MAVLSRGTHKNVRLSGTLGSMVAG